MKEKLFKFLFGDKEAPEQTPNFLFKDDWKNYSERKQRDIIHRAAVLIVSMIPDGYVNKSVDKYGSDICEIIGCEIAWKHREFIDSLVKCDPIPLKTKDEFIRFLCQYVLEKEAHDEN